MPENLRALVEREARWYREREACLEKFVERTARAICDLPELGDRRAALREWDEGRPLRARLERAVREEWRRRRNHES